MPVERLYIYRRDATNACALTGEKNDPRLPAPLAPDRWQFWMQINCHQTEEGLHGFEVVHPENLSPVQISGFDLILSATNCATPRSPTL